MPRLLFLITSDPRTSHRPAEAIRIAAGVGVWKKAEIKLYLRDAAVLILREAEEDIVDEENFTRYLPLLADFSLPIYVQRGAPLLVKLAEPLLPFQDIDDAELALLAANSTSLLRF